MGTTRSQKIVIEIKQKHIDEGVANCCNNCPIALAIKDYFGNECGHINVQPSFVQFVTNNEIYYANLTKKASKFVTTFDDYSEYVANVVNPTKIALQCRVFDIDDILLPDIFCH